MCIFGQAENQLTLIDVIAKFRAFHRGSTHTRNGIPVEFVEIARKETLRGPLALGTIKTNCESVIQRSAIRRSARGLRRNERKLNPASAEIVSDTSCFEKFRKKIGIKERGTIAIVGKAVRRRGERLNTRVHSLLQAGTELETSGLLGLSRMERRSRKS